MNLAITRSTFVRCTAIALITTALSRAADIGTAFTYQGNLENGSGPVTDTCDFRFGLWDAAAAGAQSGASPQTVALVDVVAGSFTVALDFGVGAINGDARWLEIEVQCPGDAGFTLLSPRLELTPAPHATRAVSGVGPPAALEVDSVNGRIGIGTTTPDEPLTVVGTVHSAAGGFRFPDGSTQATADTGDTLAGLSCAASEVAKWDGSQWVCAADQDTDTDTDTDTLGELSCAAGEVAKWDGAAWACSSDGGGDGHSLDAVDGDPIDAVYVNDEGRVGIGTTAPTQPLHVMGTVMAQNPGTSPVGSTVRLGGPSSDPGLVIQRGDGIGGVARQWDVVVEHDNSLEIRDNTAGGVERIMIDTTGRVGIGTTSPTTQLDVSGDLHASGTIASGNSITIDGTAHTVTSDADMEIHLADGRVMRYESNSTAPNIIGGHPSSTVSDGVVGATITGGGFVAFEPISSYQCDGFPGNYCRRCSLTLGTCVNDSGCPVGEDCSIVDDTICTALNPVSFCEPIRPVRCVGGSEHNQPCGTCLGGPTPGNQCSAETNCGIGGTCEPTPSLCGDFGMCTGGNPNMVLGNFGTVSGGSGNLAIGTNSVVPGGILNIAGGDFSFAGGRFAHVRSAVETGDSDGDAGSFVWNGYSGGSPAPFTSTGPSQFLIAGLVGINTNAPQASLHVDGAAYFGRGFDRVGINTTSPSQELHVVGDIVYTGTITDISDERLKEDITPVADALEKILHLRGVYFNMTDTPDQRDVGLIAQDVQSVLPEAVSVVDPEKGYLGVAYPSVIPLLVEAIKEQNSALNDKDCQIQSLDTEVTNLKSEIDELKSLVKALADRHNKGDE